MNGKKGMADRRANAADDSWLPPAAEWDFRTVSEAECGMACFWEYARSVPAIRAAPGEWGGSGAPFQTALGWCLSVDEQDKVFPGPFVSLSDASRKKIAGWGRKLGTATRVRRGDDVKTSLKGWIDRAMVEGRDWRQGVDHVVKDEMYLLQADFRSWGVGAVVRELTAWARAEAKRLPKRPRGKGADLPYECLKWLAVLRLEAARRLVGVKFGGVQEAVRRHQRACPVQSAAPVLPIYASHGAWSKAKRDAQKLVDLLAADPVAFQERVLLF